VVAHAVAERVDVIIDGEQEDGGSSVVTSVDVEAGVACDISCPPDLLGTDLS